MIIRGHPIDSVGNNNIGEIGDGSITEIHRIESKGDSHSYLHFKTTTDGQDDRGFSTYWLWHDINEKLLVRSS